MTATATTIPGPGNGGPHWSVVFDHRGGHTHVTFWTGQEGQRAKCGTIIVDKTDSETLMSMVADRPDFKTTVVDR